MHRSSVVDYMAFEKKLFQRLGRNLMAVAVVKKRPSYSYGRCKEGLV